SRAAPYRGIDDREAFDSAEPNSIPGPTGSGQDGRAPCCRRRDLTPRAALGQAQLEGFDLHATVFVRANDRAGLERLCGYVLRPPFAPERLARPGFAAVSVNSMANRFFRSRELRLRGSVATALSLDPSQR